LFDCNTIILAPIAPTRHHILDGVKASLKRLQFDHIDLYQIHGFDPATPIEETVRALDQLLRHRRRPA
jgi:aryl-alcohol dehydrogenase-like predicted oxidoreductase